MKIIVDEMPRHERDCLLSKMKNDDWICGKYNSICNIDMCDLLKPITDFCVGEEVYMDSSGVKIIKNGLDIKKKQSMNHGSN